MRAHSKPLRRVAMVEDDADIRDIAEIALADIGGFEVSLCASGGEAIDTLGAFLPDMILLDVHMPDLDGPATLTALRRVPVLGAVPAVFLTADDGEARVRGLLGLGAVAVIAKPFDPVGLADRLRAIWADCAP